MPMTKIRFWSLLALYLTCSTAMSGVLRSNLSLLWSTQGSFPHLKFNIIKHHRNKVCWLLKTVYGTWLDKKSVLVLSSVLGLLFVSVPNETWVKPPLKLLSRNFAIPPMIQGYRASHLTSNSQVTVRNRSPPMMYANSNTAGVELALREAYTKAGNAAKAQPQLLVCILPTTGVCHVSFVILL